MLPHCCCQRPHAVISQWRAPVGFNKELGVPYLTLCAAEPWLAYAFVAC